MPIDTTPRPAGRSARIFLLAAVALASACGSGGGGGPSGGSSGGDFDVDRSSVTFTSVEKTELPGSVDLSLTIRAPDAAMVIAGFPANVAVPGWLSLTPWGSVASPKVQLNVTTTDLAVGVYTAMVRIAIARSDGSLIAMHDLPVRYEVTTGVGAIPLFPMTATGIVGSSVQPDGRPIHVRGTAGMGWTATSDEAWCTLTQTRGTVPADIAFTVNSAGLRSGTHIAHVTIAGGATTSVVTVALELALPTLTAAEAKVALGGGGHDLSARTLGVRLDTGTNAHPYTATTPSAWLNVLPSSGALSSGEATLSFVPSAAAGTLPPGDYATEALVTATIGDETVSKSIPVTLHLDEHRLDVSATGVALTSVPGATVLTRALALRSNRGLTTSWSASSDAAWLSVTTAGSTADALELTAEPAGLAADALHEALVTITPEGPDVANVLHVRVGLWVGTAAPRALDVLPPLGMHLVADPVRPWFYATSGWQDLQVVHVYTGAVLRTVPLAGAALGSMAVTGDGSRLYVVDEGSPRRVVALDLPTLTPGTGWPRPGPLGETLNAITWVRSNGTGLVIDANGEIRGEDGTLYAAHAPSGMVAASADGSVVCGVDSNSGPFSLYCAPLDTSGGVPSVGTARRGEWGNFGFARDLAVSPSGDLAYVTDGFRTHVYATRESATSTWVPPPMRLRDPLAAPDAYSIAVAPGGGLVEVTYDRVAGVGTVRVYGADGTPVAQTNLGAQPMGGSLAVSGDGLRAAVLIGFMPSEALRVVTLP